MPLAGISLPLGAWAVSSPASVLLFSGFMQGLGVKGQYR